MTGEVRDPSERVGYLLWQTAHTFERVMGVALDELGLTPAQFGLLVHSAREPGVSAAELARRVNVTPQSVQTALRALESRGLLERRPHPVHGKVLGIVLTEAGLEVTRRADTAVDDADAAMLARLSPDERRQLHQALQSALVTMRPAALDRSSLRSVGGGSDLGDPRV